MAFSRLQRIDTQPQPCERRADAALGDQLKLYFDTITAGPVPERLLKLTEALEQAFERGELRCGRAPPIIR